MPTIYGLPSDGSVPAHLAPAVRRDAGETLAAKLDTGVGDAVLAVLGDSTGNAPDEWAYLTVQALAAAHPDLRVLYRLWDDGAQDYGAETELQAGDAPASGVVFRDTFTRTGDLYGSTPDLGPVWGGYGNSPGDWTLNGAEAVRTTDATASEVIADGGIAGDQGVHVEGHLNTLYGTATRLNRFWIKYASSADHLFAQISVPTSGSPLLYLFARVGNSSTQLGSPVTISGLTANVDQAPYTIDVQLNGSEFSATVNGATATATLTDAQLQAVTPGTKGAVTLSTVPTGSGSRMSLYELSALGTPQPAQTLRVFNGSMSGSRLGYQADRLALMLPVAPDLVLISSCHNYGGTLPDAYVDEVDTFVEQVLDLHPGTGVAVSSQNPQKPPATNRAPHAARLVALRPAALRRGWGYIAAFEAFRAQADKGDSMIAADGVHPVAAGSQLWRDAALRYIDRLTLTP